MHSDHVYEGDIDLPIRVRIAYHRHPGCPEEGPSYACGGTPASPAEIDGEVVEIVIAGKRHLVTGAIADVIAGYCREDMEFLAAEADQEARDEAAERRAA